MNRFEDYIYSLNNDNKQRFLKVIYKIQELRQITPSKEPIAYHVPVGDLDPEIQHERLIIEKLVELKVVRIPKEYEELIGGVYVLVVKNDLLKELITILTKSPSTDKTRQPIKWPSNFYWKDDNIFVLDGKEEIVFLSKKDNKTKAYFQMMTEAKTWVNVTDMAKKTSETPQQVRIKINQIKEKIKTKNFQHIITIEAKRDQVGAYRLVPHLS